MAYCKIHPIRATVSGAINYITAPQKTDRNCLVSAYECSPETAPDGAAYMLKKDGFDPDKIDLDALKSGYAEMNEQKQNAMQEYNSLSSDVRKLEKLTDTLERYLEKDAKDRARTKGNEMLS